MNATADPGREHPAPGRSAGAKVFLSGRVLGDALASDYRYTRVWRQGERGWQVAGGSDSAVA
ncbi:MAG TPA: hypothetical protein VLS96_14155 [Nodosilinea sp.]|nr:hypothetical protein [Nodosilinea sp.]